MAQISFDSTIKCGLSVTVEATIHPPEPDIGIFHRQVEIQDIFWPRATGKRKFRRVPDCLFNYAVEHDRERLEEEALEASYE